MIYKSGTYKDLAYLDKSQPVFVDSETKRFFHDMRLLQVYQENWDLVIEFDINKLSLELLWGELKNYHIVGHNFLYDLHVLHNSLGLQFELPIEWDDTFYASRLVLHTKTDKFSLDACLEVALGFDPYAKAGLNKKDLQSSNWSAEPLSEAQKLYAAIDVYELPHLWNKVKRVKNDFVYKLDILTAEHCLPLSSYGLPISKKRLGEERAKTYKLIAECDSILPKNLNVNSYKQVRVALSEEFGRDVTESDATALSIFAYRDGSKIAKAILEKRKYLKRLNFIDKLSKMDRLKGHFSPHAVNGRLASQEDNPLAYPRDLKNVYECAPGRILIYSDYAQLELRSIAAVLPEPTMEKQFRNGVDLHTFVSEKLPLENLPEGVKPRFVAKQCNFGLLYGAGYNRFQEMLVKEGGVWIPMNQVKVIYNAWKDTFKDIREWHTINARRANHNDLTDMTLSGRGYTAKMYTDLNNIKNSGSAAEVTKLALHYIYKYSDYVLPEGYNLCLFQHDSYVIEGPNETQEDIARYEKVARNLARVMQAAWWQVTKQVMINPNSGLENIHDLPMPVKVNCGPNWGLIEEDDDPMGSVYQFDLDGMELYGKSLEEELEDVD